VVWEVLESIVEGHFAITSDLDGASSDARKFPEEFGSPPYESWNRVSPGMGHCTLSINVAPRYVSMQAVVETPFLYDPLLTMHGVLDGCEST
jgi:hypothetical protein